MINYKEIANLSNNKPSRIEFLLFDNTGTMLVSLHADCSINLWNTKAYMHIVTLSTHEKIIKIAFNKKNNLMSAFNNKTIKV